MGRGVKTPSGEVITLKTSFDVSEKLEAFYTGGKVQVSGDGQRVFCTCGSSVKVLSTESGRVESSIDEEEDQVTCFAVSGDNSLLVVAWRSLQLKQYDWQSGKCTRSWKGHLSPVMSMTFDASSTLLATGASDSSIKVWDCLQSYCTHNLRGSKGVVNLVQFHPDPEQLTLFSCSQDCAVRVWDLKTSRCTRVLEGHVSAVTALGFSPGGSTMLSAGRDKVVHVWELSSGKLRRTLPVFEAVEGLVVLPSESAKQEWKLDEEKEEEEEEELADSGLLFATAGDKCMIRVWHTSRTQPLASLEPLVGGCGQQEAGAGEAPQAYTDLQYCSKLGALVGVTFDHNIVLYDTCEYKKTKLFAGYLDEVLDLCYVGEGDGEGHIAVATNSEQVKVFDRAGGGCQVLTGHSDIVLCLDCCSGGGGGGGVRFPLLATSSKDNSIRVWKMDASSSCTFTCVAVGTGHTQAVGAVALSRLKGSFVVSASQDCTVKLWGLRGLCKSSASECPLKLAVKFTQLAHEKDINSLDVSPNDKLFVSASQDKTAKLWAVSDGALLGVFRGHKRGVWSARFSPVDQCVATASSDGTVRLWALSDFSCVKTFEGHSGSVLKAVFLSRGMQLASCGSDGLVKVWTIKSNECVATLDQHTEKVWSLAVLSDGAALVSGGADSLICHWKDTTAVVEAAVQAEKEQLLIREQQLSSLLFERSYHKALSVALSLEQPFRVLGILQELLDGRKGGQRDTEFADTVQSLRDDQKCALLKYLAKWNMNGKHSRVAQSVLSVLLRSCSLEQLMAMEDMAAVLESLLPYTERHYQRLARLQQLSTFVDYTWQCMKLPAADDPPSPHTLPPPPSTLHSSPVMVSAPADSTTQRAGSGSEESCQSSEDEVTSTSATAGATRQQPKVKRQKLQKFKGHRGIIKRGVRRSAAGVAVRGSRVVKLA